MSKSTLNQLLKEIAGRDIRVVDLTATLHNDTPIQA